VHTLDFLSDSLSHEEFLLAATVKLGLITLFLMMI
jgi:hypothetical protein